jgi:hypothetical protein
VTGDLLNLRHAISLDGNGPSRRATRPAVTARVVDVKVQPEETHNSCQLPVAS